jgi:hypothetical protein
MLGRGKRVGARVTYFWYVSGELIYLIYADAKNQQSDLTPAQANVLAALRATRQRSA